MKNSTIFKTANANAHAITREIKAQFPYADYRATFALAMQTELAAARLAAELDETPDAVAAWLEMDGDAQYNAVQRMTFYQFGRRHSRLNRRTGEFLPDLFAWVDFKTQSDDLQTVAADAWLRLAEQITDGKLDAETPLAVHIARAVLYAAFYLGKERRNPSALRTRPDGTEYTIDAQPLAERIAPSPEYAALLRAEIEDACRDDIDMRIALMTGAGYTERDIAPTVDMTNVAVHYRIAGIRRRHAERIAAAD